MSVILRKHEIWKKEINCIATFSKEVLVLISIGIVYLIDT